MVNIFNKQHAMKIDKEVIIFSRGERFKLKSIVTNIPHTERGLTFNISF